MKKLLIPMIFLILLSLPATVLAREITLSTSPPVEDEALTLILVAEDAPACRLKVIYRPNSETAKEEEVGAFRGDGTIQWTPSAPGIASLQAVGPDNEVLVSENVAIRFSGIPAYGVLVMVLAGILLFGGAGVSLRLALRESLDTE